MGSIFKKNFYDLYKIAPKGAFFMNESQINSLLPEIKKCRLCEAHIDPNPVLSFHKKSKIIIIGQAPGRKVHESGIPWNDKSGEKLRSWLGVDGKDFYNVQNFGIVPMGFCFPGKGKSGDLPPRPECARTWHEKLMKELKDVRLVILIGQYAQNHYLKDTRKESVTSNVENYKKHLPDYFVLPHPSPRNIAWMKRHPWFEKKVLPELKQMIREILR